MNVTSLLAQTKWSQPFEWAPVPDEGSSTSPWAWATICRSPGGRAATCRARARHVQGLYVARTGSGKTFFSRWLQSQAQRDGFATTEVQISETETPLHKLETVYRRAMENLRTHDCQQGAFRHIVENWFYSLEEEVLNEGHAHESESDALAAAVGTCWRRDFRR